MSMTVTFPRKQAHEAGWARRIALFFVQLLVLTALLHRFAPLSTPAALNLLALCLIGLLVALGLATAALIRVWFGNYSGTLEASFAIIVALIGLAPSVWIGYLASQHPALTDIATTPSRPVPVKDQSVRPPDARPVSPPTPNEIAKQEAAYRDIHPLMIERSTAEAFALVREAMRRLEWEIVLSEPPVQNSLGYLQATARTLVMGFTDDVAVEVAGDEATATIDMRSLSRYGRHDLGANADRIRALFAEVKEGIRKGERPVLEEAEPAPPIPTRKDR